MKRLLHMTVVSAIAALGAEMAAQESHVFVFERSCDILPGKAAAVTALVLEWCDSTNSRLPDNPASVFQKHLWSSGERSMHLAVRFPGLAAYEARRWSDQTEPIVQFLGRRAAESYDMRSCLMSSTTSCLS